MRNETTTRETQHPIPSTLPATGFLRLPQIIGKRPTKADPQGIPALVPVSRASWWAGVRQRRYPSPVKLGPNTTAWRVEDIRALIQRMGGAA